LIAVVFIISQYINRRFVGLQGRCAVEQWQPRDVLHVVVGNCLMVVTVVVVITVAAVVVVAQLFLLNALLQVYLCVSLLFVGSRKFASASVAGERFLASVRADVGGEVIGS